MIGRAIDRMLCALGLHAWHAPAAFPGIRKCLVCKLLDDRLRR